MSDAARLAERELSARDRARLEAALRALSDAVGVYERFVGGPLEPGRRFACKTLTS